MERPAPADVTEALGRSYSSGSGGSDASTRSGIEGQSAKEKCCEPDWSGCAVDRAQSGGQTRGAMGWRWCCKESSTSAVR